MGKSWYSMIPVHVKYRSKRNLFTFGDFGVWRGRVREKRENNKIRHQFSDLLGINLYYNIV